MGRKSETWFSLRDMAETLATEHEKEQLLQLVMSNASRVLDAERSTLFLVDSQRRELWSKFAQGLEVNEIRMPVTVGIAGWVAVSGQTLNIHDPHEDPRFNPEVDQRTGYQTRNILCMPLRDSAGGIVGVIQVLNKRCGVFTENDEAELSNLCSQAARLVCALAAQVAPSS